MELEEVNIEKTTDKVSIQAVHYYIWIFFLKPNLSTENIKRQENKFTIWLPVLIHHSNF